MPRKPGEKYIVERKRRTQHEYNATRPRLHEFYHSPEWRRLREWYRIHHPLCEECERNGRVVLAQVIDHIVEIADGGSPLDVANLQSLCHACHNRKHGAVSQGRGV